MNVWINGDMGLGWATQTTGTWVTPEHLCPDLLRYEQIGAADGARGRVVRAFFWLLQLWPPRGTKVYG